MNPILEAVAAAITGATTPAEARALRALDAHIRTIVIPIVRIARGESP